MSSTLRGEWSETSSPKRPLRVFVFRPPLFYAFIFLRQLFSLVIFFTRRIIRPTTALYTGRMTPHRMLNKHQRKKQCNIYN